MSTTAASSTQRIFLRAKDFASPPPPFRTGTAGLVHLDERGDFDLEERVQISANSLHALIGHGVVDRLNELALEGSLGTGAPVMIRPSLVEDARSILYDADSQTYGSEWEFVVAREEGKPPTEYCLRVVNREYQITLVRIVDVLNRASRHGAAVWLAI